MKNRYRVVLVEDEPKAREQLKRLVSEYSEFVIVGEAGSLGEADEICTALVPDLVFCDVMLPGGMIFDWLLKLEKVDFDLIFITSHHDFAIHAFRLAALDYLLKPLDPMAFQSAVDRFLSKKDRNTEQIQQLIHNLKSPIEKIKIALPTMHGYLFVSIRDIIRCESDNTYTTFFLKRKQKVLVSRTLKEVEGMLENFGFFRVHNSNLVNLEEVVEYFKGEGGQVKLSDGSIVDVSRRRKEEFLERIRSF